MKLWLRLAPLIAFLLLPIARPAAAQYMFLDTNGDGLHTAADQLNSNGTPTTVDVYLVTNMNRDGTPATCDADAGATPLTMNSYVINLMAANGKVQFSNFINDQTTMTVAFGEVNPDSVRYKNGFGQQAALPPGKYKLATLTIKGVSGSPKVDIVDEIVGSPDVTSFGTQCAGNDFDNTYKLSGPAGGTDWHDVDGLPAAPGGGNVPPTITVAADTTAVEGTPFTVEALVTDPDVSDILTITATTTAPFLTFASTPKTSPATATESGTPPALSRGTYTINWSVSDGSNSPVTATTHLTVIGGDQCPVLTAIGNKTVTAGELLTFTATATDPDVGQVLTFSLDAGAPSGAAINGSTGVFTWTPTAAQAPGVYTITVRVTDNGTPIPCAVTQTFTVTVNEGTVTNQCPVLAPIGNKTVTAGSLLAFTATATDADVGQTLTFSLGAGAPAGATINSSTGAFAWTPANSGSFPIDVRVTDNGTPACTDSEMVNVTVNPVSGNQCPVLAPIGGKTTNEMALLTFTATATDADAGQTLTFSLDAGAPAGAAINGSTGVFTWTPTEAQGPGTYTITVRVTDNGTPTPCSVFESVVVVVNEVNVCPVLAPIANKTVNAGALLTFTATATDADLPANTLTFSLDAGAPTGAAINSSTGVFTWTPTAGQAPGMYTITVRVTDNGTPEPCAVTQTFDVTVNAAGGNQCPVLAPIGGKTTNEMALLTFTATATDADAGQTLTFSLDAGAPAGAAINGSTGVFTWTPTEAQGPGVYTITVRVTDNGTPTPCSVFESIVVVVDEVNQCPVLTPIANKTVNAGALLTFTATATDADLPANTLTFSLDAGAPAGASIGSSTGIFTWTPTAGQAPGVYTITARVTDNGTPEPCAVTQMFTVTVNAANTNQCPVLTPIANKTVDAGSMLTFTATATDADVGQTLTFTLDAGAPAGASIGSSTGIFTWTPTAGQAPGIYTITVRVADNATPTPCSVTQTFTVTVNAAGTNQCPVLTPIGNATVTAGNVLTFTATATDADVGQTLTFSLDAGAPTGASIGSSSGIFTWTPTAGQAPGVYTITVRVTDNATPTPCSVTQSFVVTVNPSGGTCGNVAANAFVQGGNVKTKLWTGKPTTCVQIEPVQGSFQISDVVLSSIVMSYNGKQITAVSAERTKREDDQGDEDARATASGNNAMQITACFSKQDLRSLFAGLPNGANNVDVTITGNLSCGGTFTADLSLTVFSNGDIVGREHGKGNGEGDGNGKGNGNGNGFDNGNGKGDTGNIGNKKFSAHASPNPMNPETVLSFQTSRDGAVKVTVFDLSGRLVNRLFMGTMPAGTNSVRWNGTRSDGNHVASGVYYFKVQSVDGTAIVRITVLK